MRSTNEELIKLTRFLKKVSGEKDAGVWRATADQLEKGRSRRAEVNIGRIARFTSANETIVVPGKVLGSGTINHPVRVAAFEFSTSAITAIADAGGKCLSIRELVEANPAGKGIRIVG